MAAVIKRRTKMVSIRMRDSEYARLKELCAARGARSVSDLARDAMFRLLEGAEGDGAALALEDRVHRLDRTVAELGLKMEAIEGRLGNGRRSMTWAK